MTETANLGNRAQIPRETSVERPRPGDRQRGWSLAVSTEGRVRGKAFEEHVGPKIIMRNCNISTVDSSMAGHRHIWLR